MNILIFLFCIFLIWLLSDIICWNRYTCLTFWTLLSKSTRFTTYFFFFFSHILRDNIDLSNEMIFFFKPYTSQYFSMNWYILETWCKDDMCRPLPSCAVLPSRKFWKIIGSTAKEQSPQFRSNFLHIELRHLHYYGIQFRLIEKWKMCTRFLSNPKHGMLLTYHRLRAFWNYEKNNFSTLNSQKVSGQDPTFGHCI